jgi:hypothetical protein
MVVAIAASLFRPEGSKRHAAVETALLTRAAPQGHAFRVMRIASCESEFAKPDADWPDATCESRGNAAIFASFRMARALLQG